MEDIPQPAGDRYEKDDRVRVYLDETDPESRHNGKTGVVIDVLQDSLGEETGREVDSYSYQIQVDGDTIDVWFRHRDLVPA
jgi:ribosomal protein L21E